MSFSRTKTMFDILREKKIDRRKNKGKRNASRYVMAERAHADIDVSDGIRSTTHRNYLTGSKPKFIARFREHWTSKSPSTHEIVSYEGP